MKDLISVITPMYNRQDVIGECVRSVLGQSYRNFEIILIDDGSSDQTLAVCQELAKEDPRVKLLTAAHGGVSAARNKGLEAAAGEYVFFLDSDDVIHPRLLEALVDGLKSSDAAIAGTACVNIKDAHWDLVGKLIERFPGPGETTYQDHAASLRAMFQTDSPINVIGGVMMRRALIGQTRFRTDIHIGEDYYFVYENLIKGASTVFLKQKWYYCRLHANNSSWDYGYSGFRTRFYRRELVWKSEEAFGRTEFATHQKLNAYAVCQQFVLRNPPLSEDNRKIRQVAKEYRHVFLPVLRSYRKLLFYIFLYMPYTFAAIYRLKEKLAKPK